VRIVRPTVSICIIAKNANPKLSNGKRNGISRALFAVSSSRAEAEAVGPGSGSELGLEVMSPFERKTQLLASFRTN